ncbi:hypothetical protein BDP27DRAFT_1409084 [Rhodocollybia butyracea]|uniref:Uncharacterized protein n=1 Tax=Rhodocollybia butyracea TaxID=206335 RepID=A0A9P5TWU8_9AGAR|nr:hypothetical protein BDP27DRAFT_1409084 [Rhodocollybia butyracea]
MKYYCKSKHYKSKLEPLSITSEFYPYTSTRISIRPHLLVPHIHYQFHISNELWVSRRPHGTQARKLPLAPIILGVPDWRSFPTKRNLGNGSSREALGFVGCAALTMGWQLWFAGGDGENGETEVAGSGGGGLYAKLDDLLKADGRFHTLRTRSHRIGLVEEPWRGKTSAHGRDEEQVQQESWLVVLEEDEFRGLAVLE